MTESLNQTNLYANNPNIFNILYNCDCCIRHNTNKPQNINQILPECKEYIIECDCKCPCRHYLRWLCRINIGIYPVNIELFNDGVCHLCNKITLKNDLLNMTITKTNNDNKITEDKF